MFLSSASTVPENDGKTAGELYKKYKRFLYARAYGILHSREDAEDAVETAMIGVIRNIGRFRCASEQDVLCQLSIYVRNAAIGIYRKKHLRSGNELSLSEETVRDALSAVPDPTPPPEDQILDREAVRRAEAIVAELQTPIRDAVMLVCFYRYSVADAAQILAVSPNAVSLRLYRARKLILEKLEKPEESR